MTGRYRVWDGEKMWYPIGNEWYLDQEGLVYHFDWRSRFLVEEKNATALYATGHTVKNAYGTDRELYDGDIVEWRGADEGYSANISEIVWDIDLCQYARQLGIGWKIGLSQRVCPQLTLLGNRYEDPELIEGGGE